VILVALVGCAWEVQVGYDQRLKKTIYNPEGTPFIFWNPLQKDPMAEVWEAQRQREIERKAKEDKAMAVEYNRKMRAVLDYLMTHDIEEDDIEPYPIESEIILENGQ
jgi:hypothetical protein